MKRRVTIGLLVFVILAAFIVWLEPTRVVWGWLRGEAFYRGRPTSYWSGEVAAWTYYPLGMAWVRSGTKMEHWLASLQGRQVEPVEMPQCMFRDADALPMLRELLGDANPKVRHNAQTALEMANLFSRGEP